MSDKPARSKREMQLVASASRTPSVRLEPGMKLEVVAVSLVDEKLAKVNAEGSRLCGGSGTCLAIVHIGDDVINPAP
ncbi:MAG TPA: hypothetical protein VE871_05675 [Longimicrobium sp.]|nr:hypothetical protein [Longimicrobium sp.]